jgi:hypothetical protein
MPRTPHFQGFVWGMYDNAHWQWTEHQFAAAILLSQVACEMGARNAFTVLLVRRDGPMDDDAAVDRAVPDFSFMEEGTRRLWTELTGESVTGSPKDVWKAYHEHVERRNRVAHGLEWGDRNGGDDAYRSWVAAGAFIARLDATMERVDAQDPGA